MNHDESTPGRLGAFRPTRRQFVTGLATGSVALGLGLARVPASAGTPARRGGAALGRLALPLACLAMAVTASEAAAFLRKRFVMIVFSLLYRCCPGIDPAAILPPIGQTANRFCVV